MMLYKRDGKEALISRKASGPQSKLTEKQHKRLYKMITEKNPQQLQFDFALWSLPLIAELIERKFHVVLHKTTVSRILHGMGLTPQVPVRQAYRRNEKECQTWATKEFPEIVRQIRKKQAVLLFSDEAGVQENSPIGRTWAVRGQTPVVRASGKRTRVNVISAISPRGRLWFRCYNGTLTAKKYIEFLRCILQDIRGEIFLIIDSHPAHVAAATRQFITAHSKRLHIFYLPGYAPDLNPDEHVWAHLKRMFREDPLKKGEDFSESVELSMEQIKTNPDLVRKFFDLQSVQYVKKALSW
jgi:transposase